MTPYRNLTLRLDKVSSHCPNLYSNNMTRANLLQIYRKEKIRANSQMLWTTDTVILNFVDENVFGKSASFQSSTVDAVR
jgi:hypothetical protein